MKTVIEMAIEAGFMAITNDDPDVGAWYECFTSEIEAFAALVRADAIADEREACAKVCESFQQDPYEERLYRSDFAAAIRARSTT